MQALTCLLAQPRTGPLHLRGILIGLAHFGTAKDADQAFVNVVSLLDLGSPLFLRDTRRLNMNVWPLACFGELAGVLLDMVAGPFDKLPELRKRSLMVAEKRLHTSRVIETGQRSPKDDPIESRQNAEDVLTMLFQKTVHPQTSRHWPTDKTSKKPILVAA